MSTSPNLINFDKKIILASASPRRQELLKLIVPEFEVCPSDFDESLISLRKPSNYVTELAFQKANFISNNQSVDSIIIGFDTCVVLDGEIMNKPIDKIDAYYMLKKLSNNRHQVFTGISIINKTVNRTNEIIKTYKKTDVKFRELFDEEIVAYIDTGSPLDKAGAYGIQDDFGAVFVEEIRGCYYNIVGLPLELLFSKLIKLQ